MLKMGLAPIYQHPRTSAPYPQRKVYPYLLRYLTIDRPNQVWCALAADTRAESPTHYQHYIF
jgi:putative transposase